MQQDPNQRATRFQLPKEGEEDSVQQEFGIIKSDLAMLIALVQQSSQQLTQNTTQVQNLTVSVATLSSDFQNFKSDISTWRTLINNRLDSLIDVFVPRKEHEAQNLLGRVQALEADLRERARRDIENETRWQAQIQQLTKDEMTGRLSGHKDQQALSEWIQQHSVALFGVFLTLIAISIALYGTLHH